jgi:hypothetical protein
MRNFLASAMIAAATVAAGADWPMFRGIDGTGVSQETGLLREWPTNGPTVAWSVPLSLGFSGTSVQTGELFLLAADPDHFRVLSRAKVLDADGGKTWAPTALSDGRLLVRDQTTLKCLLVAPPPTGGAQPAGGGK